MFPICFFFLFQIFLLLSLKKKFQCVIGNRTGPIWLHLCPHTLTQSHTSTHEDTGTQVEKKIKRQKSIKKKIIKSHINKSFITEYFEERETSFFYK